jgi:histidinol phosphatase-like PHP family hydrolase
MRGCKFTTSDDCHAIADVGSNYDEMLKYLRENGIECIYSADGSEYRV